MTIKNTYTKIVESDLEQNDTYVFNLKHCMYLSRDTPRGIRFVFGTHNLVLMFKTLEATHEYMEKFSAYLEGTIDSVIIDDDVFEGDEIETRE